MLKFLMVLLVTAAFAVMPAAALAEHPDNDNDERNARTGQQYQPGDETNPDPQLRRDNPLCSETNHMGEYQSIDGEWWDCLPDPGLIGVPATEGQYFWEPDPDDYMFGGPDFPPSAEGGGGDVEFAVKWTPISIPGQTGVYMRQMTRSEWVNPDLTQKTKCPAVTGGCKYKGGSDIWIRKNKQPFLLNKTWFQQALQLYVYNAATKVWDLKEDTGWKVSSSTAAYVTKLINTVNYGTAKYGAAWYYVRGWARAWNGSTWAKTVQLDPKPGGGSIGVWDDKPEDAGKPHDPAPKKAPKVKAPKADFVTAAPSESPTA